MSPITIATLGGIIAMFGYGMADIFAKKGIDEVGHYVSLVYVYIFALMFTVPLLIFDHTIPRLDPSSLAILSLFAVGDYIAYLALYKAYEIGKVSILNPITATYAVLSAVISALFFGEFFGSIKIVSFVLVMSGVVLTSVDFRELRDGLQSKDFAKGVPLAILCFVIYGFYVPLWDRFIDGQGWVILTIMSKLILITYATLAAKSIKKLKIKIENKKVLFWLFMVGILEGLAAAGFNWGLSASTETSITAAVGSAYPLVLVIAAYFILRERLAVNQYIGSTLIVLGVIVLGFV